MTGSYGSMMFFVFAFYSHTLSLFRFCVFRDIVVTFKMLQLSAKDYLFQRTSPIKRNSVPCVQHQNRMDYITVTYRCA